jgi:hypothetical protein
VGFGVGGGGEPDDLEAVAGLAQDGPLAAWVAGRVGLGVGGDLVGDFTGEPGGCDQAWACRAVRMAVVSRSKVARQIRARIGTAMVGGPRWSTPTAVNPRCSTSSSPTRNVCCRDMRSSGNEVTRPRLPAGR